MKLVLATKNPGKLRELKELAQDASFVDLQLAPDSFDPEETGNTFLENAIIKAKAAAQMTGLHAVSDDSGLEVYALDGRPGIHSARYCEGSDADRRHKVMKEVAALEDNENRACAFVCAMALCSPDGEVLHTTIGRWHGEIYPVEKGANGFGYDPIFYVVEKGKTSAELPAHEKNQLSHRAKAWRLMLEHIRKTMAE
jgi:XTP/dITP diphosphohydrolase